MTIDEEIKKLCAEIKPETLKAYAESKGWVLSRKIIEGLLEHKSLDAYIEEVMAEMRSSGNFSCPPGHPDCSDYCPTCWEPYLKKIVGGFRDKRIAELEIHLSALVDIEMYIIPADKDLVSMSFQDAKMCLMGMTPIKDKYEEGLKKKIADLEAGSQEAQRWARLDLAPTS